MTTSSLDKPEILSNSGISPVSLLIFCSVVGLPLIIFSLVIDRHLCSVGFQLLLSFGLVLLIASVFGVSAYGALKKYGMEIRGVGAGILVMLLILFSMVHFYARSYNTLYCRHQENLVIQRLPQVESAHAKNAAQQSESDQIGWTYVGINFGQGWDEKYFKWNDNNESLPQKDAILTATGSVHLRKDHIRYMKDEGWVNSQSVGIIHPDDKVEVLDTKTVADGFHWVKVRKIKNSKKE